MTPDHLDYGADAPSAQPADPAKLARVKDLASEFHRLKGEVADHEAAAKTAKSRRSELERRDLPAAMEETGLDLAHFPDLDFTVEIKDFAEAGLRASWPETEKQRAYRLLESSGNGDIIKRQIVIELDRDEGELAEAILFMLRSVRFVPRGETEAVEMRVDDRAEQKIAVNANSLSKLVRELLAEGKLTPEMREAWGVWSGRKASVK